MYCQKCGAENLENAAICQSCGGVFVYSKPTRTSGMAITSMILGISGFSMFGVFGITWIIGLIFGILALNKIGKSGGMLRGKGFAITGVITSAVGLALVLTIIGVWLFINSATTFSLHKKLQKQILDDMPQIKGVVCVVYEGGESDDDCTSPLFVAEQLKTEPEVAGRVVCTSQDGKAAIVKWKFVEDQDDAELYNFNITVPVDDETTSVVVRSVTYDGTEKIVFKDKQIKVYIRPAN
ncbi:MAG: DUF4190 domain-containing protein [Phycisphaerae bacterium]|nr:DUF4190 domain-containing protein [Phycisphaerae bacterium]